MCSSSISGRATSSQLVEDGLKGYAAQEKTVLEKVPMRVRGATQVTLPPNHNNPKLSEIPGSAVPALGRTRRCLRVGTLSILKSNQNSWPCSHSSKVRKTHRVAGRLHRCGARLQHGAAHFPGLLWANTLYLAGQAMETFTVPTR